MLKYLNGYDTQLKVQVQTLIDQDKLGAYLLSKYPKIHDYTTDKSLYSYVQELKNTHMRNASPISKVLYDTKIRDIHAALGTHTFVSRVQGGKIKAKNEIRISHVFKKVPESFLREGAMASSRLRVIISASCSSMRFKCLRLSGLSIMFER